ncbi:hypothetical protein B5K11_35855 [Rhizobium leguminosarum bv. trifolii]|uniref:hypothetical protein n=1 Tax=Rhizobium leguminosarum TaxID=384 RepID=UPI000E2F9CBC|nr:hypothetical protein [Rhizobium leguminosarum]RFB82004.1 hypothetical protein B5K11_35855 [Rhizobium leguminosarum bv. trifolii]
MAGCARQTTTSPVGDVVYLSLTGQCAPATPALRNIEVARRGGLDDDLAEVVATWAKRENK